MNQPISPGERLSRKTCLRHRLMASLVLTNPMNLVAFVGFLICGTLVACGLVLGILVLAMVGFYFGWFLCVYAPLAYLFGSVRYLTQTQATFWDTLYPVNLCLAILAIALFSGMPILGSARTAAAILVLEACLAFLGARMRLLDKRYMPLALFLALILSFATPFYGFVFIGMLIAAKSCLAFIDL